MIPGSGRTISGLYSQIAQYFVIMFSGTLEIALRPAAQMPAYFCP